jgi:hypothetical protein
MILYDYAKLVLETAYPLQLLPKLLFFFGLKLQVAQI